MFKAIGHYFIREIRNLKNHIFGLLSVFVKYVGPLLFVFSQSIVTKETKTRLETWCLPVLAFLILFYYFSFRKALKGKITEERLVKRLDAKRAEPLRLVLFAFIDDCVMAPLIPFLFYQLCRTLERLAIRNSTCFLLWALLFFIGGIFKVIDLLLDLTRTYKAAEKEGNV